MYCDNLNLRCKVCNQKWYFMTFFSLYKWTLLFGRKFKSFTIIIIVTEKLEQRNRTVWLVYFQWNVSEWNVTIWVSSASYFISIMESPLKEYRYMVLMLVGSLCQTARVRYQGASTSSCRWFESWIWVCDIRLLLEYVYTHFGTYYGIIWVKICHKVQCQTPSTLQ